MKERDDTGMKIETAVKRLHEEIEELLAKEAAFYQGSSLSGRKLPGSPFPGRTPLLAAIDGRCGAGKTTLAALLQERTGWSVLHIDHFFLRPEQRTEERLRTPGGNIDSERFLEEVLLPLKRGEADVSYRPYDCQRQELAAPVLLKPGKVCLIEGSYSCHPALWDMYDLHVFLSVDAREQMRRIIGRNGADGARAFRERWIPLEEKYFAEYRVEERCEVRLEITP